MPVIQSGDCPIHVVVEGREDRPVLMLSNSLGTTHRMWDAQMKAWGEHFRLVRFDRRGHGQSGVPAGPYSMEQMGRDALAVIDGLGLKTVNWCGLSMGGMDGQWLGANAPDRIEKLIISNTSSFFPDKAGWSDRLKHVKEVGLPAFADTNMTRWFTKGFLERAPEVVKPIRDMFAATPLEGYLACGSAVRDMDFRPLLPKVSVPTLVIVGRHDGATVPAAGEFIRDHVPGAKLAVIEAAHLSNVEQPDDYARLVLDFLRN